MIYAIFSAVYYRFEKACVSFSSFNAIFESFSPEDFESVKTRQEQRAAD
jgi:hypothetical protein